MKMPSLKALHSHRASSPSQLCAGDIRSALWARSNTDDLSHSQLHKFWSGLSTAARRELLRIDKQALFEQVRKNLYCSRCHGLLVEGYAQIVSYGKSLQAGLHGYGNGSNAGNKHLSEANTIRANPSLQDDTRDPSVHPWGGLAATRDSMLTVLDCFLDGTPLEVCQNVFESARARERERELLYPDACGGGGRGWISQSSGSFGGNGRGHGMKETCALHTARLSCEALVDFWSALGEETRRSLLRMKEEDFIERLMFRFDSKRFCRDCRRNVLREFKEMKELKRTRKEPRCTRWFCAADTAFRYEVSESVVQVDWRDCFAGDVGSVYQRFEWSMGSSEGKGDILGFEDVGLAESVQVDGLDLGNMTACYITVRGWKRDGRCSELSTKAHALKGQLCVHRRLIVGDGYVSITKGESIQRFFERAEETEEEEDDDAMDKDGNELDGEGSRPQKHAKSPELARDFLLDAATVIFKEQVEKAFREGTARQNAHSIFVCLALSLLEERVQVACKEITTLEKQNKLLEEEEDEKREEEERRERRKLKEKEKKLRRKEKLKGKERDKDKCKNLTNSSKTTPTGSISGLSIDNDGAEQGTVDQEEDSRSDVDSLSARPPSPDMADERPSVDGLDCENGSESSLDSSSANDIEDTLSLRDGFGAFTVERTKSTKRRTQCSQTQASDGSFTGKPTEESLESSGCGRNPARVAPAPVAETFIISSLHVPSKNSNLKQDGDTVPKRLDSWHMANGHCQQRQEDFQHCGCGGPQPNLRPKGSQRNVSRVGCNEYPSSRIGERSDSRAKGFSSNLDYGLEYPHGKLDGSKGKGFAVPPAKRKGEREQEKVESDVMEVVRPGHNTNASSGDQTREMRTVGQGLTAQNGSFTHSFQENGAPCKVGWVTHSSFTLGSPVSQTAIAGDRSFSSGNNKGTSIRPAGRARPAGVVYNVKASAATASGESMGNDIFKVGNQGPGSPSSIGAQNLSNYVVPGNRESCLTSKTAKPRGTGTADNGPPVQAGVILASGVESDRAREQVNSNEQGNVGVKVDYLNSNFKQKSGEVFQNPVVMNQFESQPTIPVTLPLKAGSEGPTTGGMESNKSRLVHNVFLSKEVSSLRGSTWATHIPVIPNPIHVHPQPSFYYQGTGSWLASRACDGVLPQPGSILEPVSSGVSHTLGSVPFSLDQTSADGKLLGRLASPPVTLHVKDSIFLSRYGEEPGCQTVPVLPENRKHPSAPDTETCHVVHCTDAPAVERTSSPVTVTSTHTMHRDIADDCTVQADSTGFSLFHFSSPASVGHKETDCSLNPALKDYSSKCLTNGSTRGPLNDIQGSASNIFTPGEYRLFAEEGKSLVFF